MNQSKNTSTSIITTIFLIIFLIASCTQKSSVKIEKMDDLVKQNRCPLDVKSFGASSGVGDVILQSMTEDSSNHMMKKYVLKAFNISDKEIIGFDASLRYYDKNNSLVLDTSATPKLNYMKSVETGVILPGDSVMLEANIYKPRGTKTKLDITEVFYKEKTKFGDMTLRWRDKNFIDSTKTSKKK